MYGPQGSDEKPAWARAHAALSTGLEAMQDNIPAALSMQRAAELATPSGAGCADFEGDLERLLRRIPEKHAAVLQVC